MNRFITAIFLLACTTLCRVTLGQAQPPISPLTVAESSAARDESLASWQLIQGTPRIVSGMAGEAKQKYLYLKREAAGPEDHVWWRRTMPVSGGDSLQVRFEGKAVGEGDYWGYVGVEFYDDAGKWLDFTEVQTIARANKKYPSAAKPAVKDWKSFTGEITVPQKARSIALRLALNSDSKSEACFRNVSVAKTSQSVSTLMAEQPAQLPHYSISASPVAANGVSLTPDWTLDGAQTARSALRTKICLNGLWAIQPAPELGRLPDPDNWAFFKVPGYFRKDIFSVYGQEKAHWSADLYSGVPVWYVRDVQILATTDSSSIFLDVSGMYAFAIKAYWNGKPAGVLTDQMGGRINLTTLANPGEKGQLAIFAVPVRPERMYAFNPNLVRTYRRGSVVQSGLLDVYLTIEPSTSRLENIRLTPSVRNRSLQIQIANPTDATVSYKIQILAADGKPVLHQDLGASQVQNDSLSFSLPWENPHLWNPDDPYLYTAVLQAYVQGRLVDESLPIKFGFREVWTQGRELFLNGHPLRLRPRLYLEYFADGNSLRRAISLLKDTGFNCIIRPSSATTDQQEDMCRWSRDEYYAITDEMGMLILSYTAYSNVSGGQFGANTLTGDDIDKLIAYVKSHQLDVLHNHPSVIAYSGFGDQPQKGMNYLYLNPEIWGIAPLDKPQFLARLNNDPVLRDRILTKAGNGRRFIEGIKKADPSRPFLAHSDTGLGDGWGIFDYFNWTPLQEWEDWPETWSRQGIMPIGSMEHGMPYPASFLNHAMANAGDTEPWITEYAAIALGNKAYSQETPEYLSFIRNSYVPATKTYSALSAHGQFADLVAAAGANFRSVWAYNNKAIYRSWRTYGVPMGIEPFGPMYQYLDIDQIAKSNGTVLANPSINLKTVGAKLDRWSLWGSFWPTEGIFSYPLSPTGHTPSLLNSVGKTLRENNSVLLAYIAGSADHFTSKDHAFYSGEPIQKQIAVIWDGFSPLGVNAQLTLRLGGQPLKTTTAPLNLTPGQILKLPLEFTAPPVTARTEGEIELILTDSTGHSLAQDRFSFQVHEPYHASDALKRARIALFDPSGESDAMFKRLGLDTLKVTDVTRIPACDILVIGRRALSKLPSGPWLQQLPSRLPVLVLEQSDADLSKIGFRAYPIRSRRAFPLPYPSPALIGLEAADLADWRVTATLLPTGSDPLRDNYNYHTNYRGAIASVTLETPTIGNFIPHIQSGFDLRETALLETALAGHRILFCQLSLPDAAGIDPVATRIAANIFQDLITTPASATSPLALIGASDLASVASDLGAPGATPLDVRALRSHSIALVGKLPEDPGALTDWVRQGGTALLLPQDLSIYARYFPSLHATRRDLSLVPIDAVPAGSLTRGIAQSNLHARQEIPQILFNDRTTLAQITEGKGQWIFLGFDPRTIDASAQPYLRLTQRNQYRLLSQLLTNLGADLSAPTQTLISATGSTTQSSPITGLGRLAPATMKDTSWTQLSFDDASWNAFDLSTKETGFGNACVRIRFSPETSAPGPLAVHLGSVDDFDETFLNGVKIGETSPVNADPEKANTIRRVYAIPDGLLHPRRENILAVRLWNRNAQSKGWRAWLRGPISIGPATESNPVTLYFGPYKPSDDPYLQMHW